MKKMFIIVNILLIYGLLVNSQTTVNDVYDFPRVQRNIHVTLQVKSKLPL